MEVLDSVVEAHSGITLHMVGDDMALSTTGPNSGDTVRAIARAAAHLLDMLHDDLKAIINQTKSIILASNGDLLNGIYMRC